MNARKFITDQGVIVNLMGIKENNLLCKNLLFSRSGLKENFSVNNLATNTIKFKFLELFSF